MGKIEEEKQNNELIKYIKPFKIGDIELKNNVLVAPMAGITDKVFRKITDKYGNPGAIGIEMVSSKGVKYRDEKTLKMVESYKGENPRIIQIFGSDVDSMVYAAKFLEPYADIIDINAGCPMTKVTKTGAGAGLLLNLENLENILREVVKTVSIPVTLKTRIGYDKKIVIDEVLEICERTGISALTIHGRFLEQIYSGDVDLKTIKRIKEKAKIPIIANGGIFTMDDAYKIFKETKVDGIMLARGIIGNPYLSKEIVEGKRLNISAKEKIKLLKEHYKLLKEFRGEERASREIRKFICYYTKGLDKAKSIRSQIANVVDEESFNKLVNKIEIY